MEYIVNTHFVQLFSDHSGMTLHMTGLHSTDFSVRQALRPMYKNKNTI